MASDGSPPRPQNDVLVQQEARLSAGVRGRGRVQEQSVHEDQVTGGCSILEHLERDAIDLFGALVKTSVAYAGVSCSAQSADVRVPLQRFAQLCASGCACR